MVTAQVTVTTPQYTAFSYLTIDEYKTAPTAIDLSNLVLGGNGAAQNTELGNQILRASSWADGFCRQQLGPTVDIESFRGRVGRDGYIKVKPRNRPVLELRDFRYGSRPGPLTWAQMTDLSTVLVEPEEFIVSFGGGLTLTNVGPLDFGGRAYGQQLYGQFTYVNGWPNTSLTAACTAGATSIQVTDPTGIYVYTRLTIYDGPLTETVIVTAPVVGNVVTCTPTINAHATTASGGTTPPAVSAMPAALKEAIILLTSTLIKTRGNEAVVMGSMDAPGRLMSIDGAAVADINLAREMLTPFRRVR